MSTYSEFFLGTAPHVTYLELIELSHFRFTQTWRFCRNCNPITGVTVTHESPPGGSFAYTYLPMQIRRLGVTNNLDQVLRVTLGDVGEIVAKELDAVFNANGMQIKPIMKYRAYSSTDLTAPMFGPSIHEILTINTNKSGVSFDAVAPRLNLARTGKLYEVKPFPMMRAFFHNGL